MLKALELNGFKSFADRTRFEFPRGISVVVGPNGSGKSNIVDAIKWVLGEQSVKSLRGKEMVDVIFNGSSTRRPLNAAETTLTFDNSDRRLGLDTPEVHVTRRVYRSGEGEYLLNHQACRLRDIRELFAGTGVATEAYSVIEQGKVDVMLQSSAKERRAIFEEAAGISRFKAKKVEALRRLERVEQNLLRLGDIVEEVDNRLRSVRAQAAKARRYKEYADRLQELRTHVGIVDWRALSDKLAEIEAESTRISGEIAEHASAAESADREASALETQAAEAENQLRQGELRLGENRERVAAIDAAVEHQRARTTDLEQQSARHRRQMQALTNRADDLAGLWQATRDEVDAAETRHRDLAVQLADQQRALTALTAQLDQIRGENEQRRATHLEQLRTSAALTNEISTLEGRLARTEESRERSRNRLEEIRTSRSRIEQDIVSLSERQADLVARLEQRALELNAAKEELNAARRELAEGQKEHSSWRERLSAALERATVLKELEKRLEGVGAGAKEVLGFAKENPEGPFQQVRGLLADLVQVGVDTAPVIEAALGEKAQYVVVAPGRRLAEYLVAHGKRMEGRVGFLPLDTAGAPPASIDLSDRLGIVGRADRYVETSLDLAPLVRRLLGATWIVQSLGHAIELSSGVGRGLNFVTLAGELVRADGTIVVGKRQATGGLISRRSELRALRLQIAEWETTVEQIAGKVGKLEEGVAKCEAVAAQSATSHHAASESLAEQRLRVSTAQQRQNQLAEQQSALESEWEAAVQQHDAALQSLSLARSRLDRLQADLAQAEARMADNTRRVEQLDATRQQRSRDALAAQVELARSEQHLDHLKTQLRRYEQDREEREQTIAEVHAHLAECQQRQSESELRTLSAEAEAAELYLKKELLAAEMAMLASRRGELVAERTAAAQVAQKYRQRIRKLEDRLHQQQLAANEVSHERATLEGRLREDYGIELSELTTQPSSEELQQREQVESEIAELRRKLANIGGVNLDSLQEVDELEARYESLSSQFQDLTQAKTSLEQIIHRINADSRRLFAETLETVKGHFQQLFRKLFGGGQADIVLEEGVDVLDSGIEIVARPPGKEPRSISLLSGGEKTLTCVALLLAIFRSRPSPFCVLDEVDAALDEANIERFVGVLKEFLQWTQFIVVTHSKKTMTAANTLYGVTMQESGISKRVSVRFDDVSDNGEISEAAIRRAEQEARDAADDLANIEAA